MKHIKIIFSLAFVSILTLTSCLKEHDVNVSTEDTTPTFVDLQFLKDGGTTINSGLQYFSGAALTYSPDEESVTETFNVSVNGADQLKSDLAVTLGVDPGRALDNIAGDNIEYEVMPDSIYMLNTTSVVIPAGQRVVTAQVTFYPSKVDATHSYILPVTITNASGRTISGNFGTIYFHIIGNPLAGVYDVVGTRYNYDGLSGFDGGTIPNTYIGTAASPSPKLASPNSTTQFTLDFANLGGNGYHYVIDYDEATQTIDVSGDFLDAVSQFTVWEQTYDPATKTIHILCSYNNGADGSGKDRVIDETFTHR